MCIRSISYHFSKMQRTDIEGTQILSIEFIKGLFLYTIQCNDIIVAKCYEHFLNVEQSADNLSYLFKCAKCPDVIV